MKKLKFLALMVAGMTVFFGCKKSDGDDDDDNGPVPADNVLQGSIRANKTLTADKVWILKGYVYVTDGVTLTIEPGTIIKSDTTEKGALTFERGAKIMAQGTAEKPIIFTSGKAVGQRKRGDWGGVVLLGRAKTNRTSTPVIEGGLDRPYGGTDDADNSGIMRYVRIEFAGVAAFKDSEINALTLGGVGSGTTIENIQISYANDDAIEIFGGTVNLKNLIAYGTADDDFDFDFGYTGKIQYAVCLRDPKIADTDDGNGIESDNENPASTSQPYTRAVLSNFTFVGPNNAPGTEARLAYANRFRRHTRFVVRNSILVGFQKGGFVIESDSTANFYLQGLSEFKNNLVHAIANPYLSTSSKITSDAMKTKAEADGCTTYANAADIMLTDPFNLSAPNFMPKAGSPALTGANFTGLDAAWFKTTDTYRGAFGTTNWMQGWTSFSPATNAY